MFNLKKIIIIGMLPLIPTYVMGSCQGKMAKNSIIASCQGETRQLSLTTINKEIFLLGNDIFNEVLRNSNTLTDIQKQLSILHNAGSIIKQNNSLLKENNKIVKSLQNQLYKQNINRGEKRELRRQISIQKRRIATIREKNSNELYRLKQQLNYSENENKNLNSLLESTASAFSSDLGSNFSHYMKCVKSNNILSQYTIPEIQRERQSSSFSSSGYSEYSQVFSALSSSGISSYSLESCANEFGSLRDRFILYEVALNLLMSSDIRRRAITRNFFKVYRGKNASERDISRFIENFKTFSKNRGLATLIQEIDAHIQTY